MYVYICDCVCVCVCVSVCLKKTYISGERKSRVAYEAWFGCSTFLPAYRPRVMIATRPTLRTDWKIISIFSPRSGLFCYVILTFHEVGVVVKLVVSFERW